MIAPLLPFAKLRFGLQRCLDLGRLDPCARPPGRGREPEQVAVVPYDEWVEHLAQRVPLRTVQELA